MSLEKGNRTSLIKEYARSVGDTGSPEVQCALFSMQIKNLTEHFNKNSKDFQARRGLLVLVNKRKRLLEYLKKRDASRHKDLIAGLGLRK